MREVGLERESADTAPRFLSGNYFPALAAMVSGFAAVASVPKYA